MLYSRASPRPPGEAPPTVPAPSLVVRGAPAAEPPSRSVSRLILSSERPDGVNAVLAVAAMLANLPGHDTIDMGAWLNGLCRNLDQTFGRTDGPSLCCSAAAHLLPMGQAITLGLVAEHLVSDAYVHGFAPGEGGRIAVSSTLLETTFEVTIDDSSRVNRGTAQGRADSVTIARLLVSQVEGSLETPGMIGGRSCIVTLPRHINRPSG